MRDKGITYGDMNQIELNRYNFSTSCDECGIRLTKSEYKVNYSGKGFKGTFKLCHKCAGIFERDKREYLEG